MSAGAGIGAWAGGAVRALAIATVACVRGLTVLMLGVLGYQVFMRSVLNAPPSWSEEVALLAFTWAVLLGIAYGVREGIHVRMDVLLDALPAPLRTAGERLVLALVVGVGVFLLVAAWRYMSSSTGTTSAAIGYPMPLLYASAVACALLIVVFGIERMVCGPAPAEADAPPHVAAPHTRADAAA